MIINFDEDSKTISLYFLIPALGALFGTIFIRLLMKCISSLKLTIFTIFLSTIGYYILYISAIENSRYFLAIGLFLIGTSTTGTSNCSFSIMNEYL